MIKISLSKVLICTIAIILIIVATLIGYQNFGKIGGILGATIPSIMYIKILCRTL